MPRFRTLLTGLVAIACAVAAAQLCVWWAVKLTLSEPEATTGPHLHLATDHLDLGRIAPGSVVEAKFVIANTGNQALIVRQSQPASNPHGSCCNPKFVVHQTMQSQELLPLRKVDPGHTSEIVLRIDAGEQPLGTRPFRFLTNDPTRPEFWLTVRATVGEPPPEEHSVLVRRK